MIRVIIERQCRVDKEAELARQLMELRTVAVKHRGYISGETLRSAIDPSRWVTISTWGDEDNWKSWEVLPDRCQITNKIEPMLTAPEKVSIFNFVELGGAQSAHRIDK
jgi:antibiotic biosynthesis monooxygenase (ABM) superfamily enzyme